jgi:hypothetical protein
MKKMLFLLAFSSMSLGMVAQETTTEIPTQKHKVVTNGFWDNWFVDLGGEFISNYSSQEAGVSRNPFRLDRGNFGINLSVGKWVTPSFGARIKVGGAWATQVNGPESSLVDNVVNPLYSQLKVTLQPMVNLQPVCWLQAPRVEHHTLCKRWLSS